jgi:hypothetical protein
LKEYNNDEFDVKDMEIKIVNAIKEISYLRSKVVSHKFSSSIQELTIYDVKNAQILSRYLLLQYIKNN